MSNQLWFSVLEQSVNTLTSVIFVDLLEVILYHIIPNNMIAQKLEKPCKSLDLQGFDAF